MQKIDFDVAIVGASIGGAALALKLGAGKFSVAVFDKDSFPRRKACGEGLSMVGVNRLSALGLQRELHNLEHHRYYGYQVWTSSGPVAVGVCSGASAVKGLGVQRFLLDDLVLKAALSTGCAAFLGERVTNVRKDGSCYEVQTKDRSVRVRRVILASGLNCPLIKKLNVPIIEPKHKRFGFSMILEGHWQETPELINVILGNGHEVYCTPLGQHRLNMNILGRTEMLAAVRKEPKFSEVVDAAKNRLGFNGTIVEKLLGAGPFGRKAKRGHTGGILLVGDCRESLDPIGGMGMSHALVTAGVAGELIAQSFEHSNDLERLLASYDRRCEQQVRALRGFTRIIYYSLIQLGRSDIFGSVCTSRIPQRIEAALVSEKWIGPPLHVASRILLAGVGAW